MFVNMLAVICFALCVYALSIAWRKYSPLVILLCSVAMYAQTDTFFCNYVVSDGAGMIDAGKVENAAQGLIGEGADVHVVTLNDAKGNLDMIELQIERGCSSWRSGSGNARKNTLIALLVSKQDHKLGIYYGGAWNNALDAHWQRIKSTYMVPYFKDGNFTGGFVNAETQLTQRIRASKDEALKPVVNSSTTVNQAADYSGLWTAFKWIIFLLSLGGACYLVFYVMRYFREKRQEISDAQGEAQATRNAAAAALKKLEDELATRDATGNTVPLTAKSYFQYATEGFDHLGNSLSSNPDSEGLSVSQYHVIAKQYSDVLDNIKRVYAILQSDYPKTGARDNKNYVKANRTYYGNSVSAPSVPSPQSVNSPPSQPSAPVTPSYSANAPVIQPTVDHTVVVVNNEPSRYEPPIYIPPVYVPYVPPVYTPPETRYEPPVKEDTGSGGGSSSWFSSSSRDDSSDNSSGGSSDYESPSSDSGSSDSGGGGSSDY